ncbi:MAG: MoaD/ThiS family protein [Gammaproteobacteria bacterium]|nr:MAG: MoaD/ThiS family protein [Gammaproteobacteria bacterium]
MIAVRFFASLRDAVGTAGLDLGSSRMPADLDGLLCVLRERLDGEAYAAITGASVRIAVNQTLVEGNAALTAGDEVAFLPPVSGG